MKKILLLVLLAISTHVYAQTNSELKSEIDNIKNELRVLKTEIQTVITQNNYLKQSLNLNAPILEIKNNNVLYQITKVEGNIKDKAVSISILINTTENDRKYNLSDFHTVDLNGNSYTIDFSKSSDTFPKLTKQVPLKFKATFLNISSDVKILKLFKFLAKINLELGSSNTIKSSQEFKDLFIDWK